MVCKSNQYNQYNLDIADTQFAWISKNKLQQMDTKLYFPKDSRKKKTKFVSLTANCKRNVAHDKHGGQFRVTFNLPQHQVIRILRNNSVFFPLQIIHILSLNSKPCLVGWMPYGTLHFFRVFSFSSRLYQITFFTCGHTWQHF